MTATATPTRTSFDTLHFAGQDILDYLNAYDGPRTAEEIGNAVAYPAASVRRWIGTLRDHGYNVITTPDGYTFKF